VAEQEKFSDPTELRHTIGAGGMFSLDNVSGSIRLIGADTREVTVRARSRHGRGDSLPLMVNRGEGALNIEVERKSFDAFGFGGRREGVDFDVTLPRAARVAIKAVSSDIDAGGLGGEQTYRTVSGDLRIEGHGGRVSATTVSGDVELVADETVEPSITTTSGDVRVAAPTVNALHVRTVSGDTQLRAGFAEGIGHTVESVSGDLSVEARSGLAVDSKRGLEVAGGSGRRLVVGDGSAELRFRSLSGDVHVKGGTDERPSTNRPPAAATELASEAGDSLEVLRALERGEIDVEEASRRLEGASSHG
jgi:hypothetical protein